MWLIWGKCNSCSNLNGFECITKFSQSYAYRTGQKHEYPITLPRDGGGAKKRLSLRALSFSLVRNDSVIISSPSHNSKTAREEIHINHSTCPGYWTPYTLRRTELHPRCLIEAEVDFPVARAPFISFSATECRSQHE